MGYNPDQPRDDKGQFGSGGGSSGPSGGPSSPGNPKGHGPGSVTVEVNPEGNVKSQIKNQMAKQTGVPAKDVKVTFTEDETIQVDAGGDKYETQLLGEEETLVFTMVTPTAPPPTARGNRYF